MHFFTNLPLFRCIGQYLRGWKGREEIGRVYLPSQLEPKRINIYTEHKPLGRLYKMCFPFFHEFRVIPSYDSAPRPPHLPPLSRQQIDSLSQSSCVSPVLQLTDGRVGEGAGCGAESYGCKKAWASMNRSILSGIDQRSKSR